ncbi:nucleotidyltransferase domain-containing protein [Chryseobacterium sp. OSA05B]|uniref:nucleotidyltransferase domain-containing protein n=1 Tax=Chryseobacterium sp. OSA05B TaxID=2862650 RepID=UPI001CBB692E|nr:nucleotidyltransferase domain-containing protein [Chryseobacterium sp. OSA05B]
MEKALEEFLNQWKNKKYVLGILLTGSYAVGLQTENSDIDIRIIFDKSKTKTLKGLTKINNYTFSYLGRNTDSIIRKLNSEFINRQKFEAYIFNIGKILYDRKNTTAELKHLAQTYASTPFLKKHHIKSEVKAGMYGLYNHKNHLINLDENSPFFHYQYYMFMKKALSFYSSYLGFESFLDTKTEKVLYDTEYRQRYQWDDFPDKIFSEKWITSIKIENISKNSAIIIYHYLESKIEKINEENFTIHWKEI